MPRHTFRYRTREVVNTDSPDRLCGWRRRHHARRRASSPQQLKDPESLVAVLESLDTLVCTSCGVSREYTIDSPPAQQFFLKRAATDCVCACFMVIIGASFTTSTPVSSPRNAASDRLRAANARTRTHCVYRHPNLHARFGQCGNGSVTAQFTLIDGDVHA